MRNRYFFYTLLIFLLILSISFLGAYFYLELKSSDGLPPLSKNGSVSNIKLQSLEPNQIISLPLEIKGEARVLGNVLNIEIKDNQDEVIFKDIFLAKSDNPERKFGDFLYSLGAIPGAVAGEKITLNLFWEHPKDNSRQDFISLPLIVNETNSEFGVFFPKKGSACSETFPLYRTFSQNEATPTKAISFLISGYLSKKEIASEFYSNLPKDIRLIYLDLKDNTATISLNKDIFLGLEDDSCRVSSIHSQIENTLFQFEGIKKVVITH